MPMLNANAEIKTSWQVSVSTALAIWGDPVVGRCLCLLLKDSGYEARFVPASSLRQPGVLKGVRLLGLTITPLVSTDRREDLLAPLEDTVEGAQIPVLELDTSPEGRRAGGGVAAAHDGPWQTVLWPCRIKELERRIEAALAATPQKLGSFSRR
jgi:hypothetical protein